MVRHNVNLTAENSPTVNFGHSCVLHVAVLRGIGMPRSVQFRLSNTSDPFTHTTVLFCTPLSQNSEHSPKSEVTKVKLSIGLHKITLL